MHSTRQLAIANTSILADRNPNGNNRVRFPEKKQEYGAEVQKFNINCKIARECGASGESGRRYVQKFKINCKIARGCGASGESGRRCVQKFKINCKIARGCGASGKSGRRCVQKFEIN
jgi:hypothetical protein